MKFLYQLILLMFIGLSLYLVRDDVLVAYEHAVPYVAKSYTTIKNEIGKISIPSDKSVMLEEPTHTPGALRVTEGLTSADKVKLSIKEVIVSTNINRAENGNLKALKENAKLDQSAKIKLQDMFNQQYFEHDSPTGVGIKQLSKKVGYEYITIGENLALGNFKDSSALLKAWMNSPGHRANILNIHYTEIGVAVGSGIFEGHKIWMAVQHFGVPRSDCPTTDEVLHSKIDLEKSNIEITITELALRKKMIENGAIYQGKTTNEQKEIYNQLVAVYTNTLSELKQMTQTYNSQVVALNDCIFKNSGH